MSTFPYAGLPQHQIWKRAVSDSATADIDPQLPARFTFDRSARVASAGSCFAIRIADALRAEGFTYFITETGPAAAHYGRYSARYGEMYTALQLRQTVARAFGASATSEPPWRKDGRYYDPLRPRAVPNGFAGVAELEADRAVHYAAVRRMISESDVFIFTLGLTETWCVRDDGTALPLCPGAGIGRFDPERYVYRNLGVAENLAELEAFLALAWSVNPALRIILTLSPVPLAATYESQHVVTATTYSKSVLRVVAQMLRERHTAVEYFAAYEIVTASGGNGFEANGRDVSAAAVARVMRSFFAAFTTNDRPANVATATAATVQPVAPAPLPQIAITLDARSSAATTASDLCNEAYLATFITSSGG